MKELSELAIMVTPSNVTERLFILISNHNPCCPGRDAVSSVSSQLV